MGYIDILCVCYVCRILFLIIRRLLIVTLDGMVMETICYLIWYEEIYLSDGLELNFGVKC
jgi:hypothetical protein